MDKFNGFEEMNEKDLEEISGGKVDWAYDIAYTIGHFIGRNFG